MAKRRNKNKKAGPVKIIRPGDLNLQPVAEDSASAPAIVDDLSAALVADEGYEAVATTDAEAQVEQSEEAEAAPETASEASEPGIAAAEEVAEEAGESAEPVELTESPESLESPEHVESAEAVEVAESATPGQANEPLPEFEDASALLAQSVPVAPEAEIEARQIESIPIEVHAADEPPAMAAEADVTQVAEPQAGQPSGGGGKGRKDRKLKLNKLQKHARSDLDPLPAPQAELQPEPQPDVEPEPVVPAEPERKGPSEPRIAAFAKLAEYQTLSLAHVAGIPEEADLPGHWRGVGFAISGRRLVTSFDEVVEIIRVPQITHVPGTQPWMLGVANVRGTLLPVVDLKQFLEGERTVMYEGQRVMVVRQSGGNVAVLIDQLYGQRAFNDSQKMAVASDGTTRYGHFIKQVYRVGDNDWGVFSMSMLTRTPEFRQAAA